MQYMEYIEKQMGKLQDLKYEIKEVRINEDVVNALDEQINITEEKMMLFYNMVKNI